MKHNKVTALFMMILLVNSVVVFGDNGDEPAPDIDILGVLPEKAPISERIRTFTEPDLPATGPRPVVAVPDPQLPSITEERFVEMVREASLFASTNARKRLDLGQSETLARAGTIRSLREEYPEILKHDPQYLTKLGLQTVNAIVEGKSPIQATRSLVQESQELVRTIIRSEEALARPRPLVTGVPLPRPFPSPETRLEPDVPAATPRPVVPVPEEGSLVVRAPFPVKPAFPKGSFDQFPEIGETSTIIIIAEKMFIETVTGEIFDLQSQTFVGTVSGNTFKPFERPRPVAPSPRPRAEPIPARITPPYESAARSAAIAAAKVFDNDFDLDGDKKVTKEDAREVAKDIVEVAFNLAGVPFDENAKKFAQDIADTVAQKAEEKQRSGFAEFFGFEIDLDDVLPVTTDIVNKAETEFASAVRPPPTKGVTEAPPEELVPRGAPGAEPARVRAPPRPAEALPIIQEQIAALDLTKPESVEFLATNIEQPGATDAFSKILATKPSDPAYQAAAYTLGRFSRSQEKTKVRIALDISNKLLEEAPKPGKLEALETVRTVMELTTDEAVRQRSLEMFATHGEDYIKSVSKAIWRNDNLLGRRLIAEAVQRGNFDPTTTDGEAFLREREFSDFSIGILKKRFEEALRAPPTLPLEAFFASLNK